MSAIDGVEWRTPDVFDGHLRLRLHGAPSSEPPDKDPASITIGMGTGLTHESLPLAAAVVAAIHRRKSAAPAEPERPAPDTAAEAEPQEQEGPGAIADRIREAAGLRDEGLISEEEFRAKKAQLLTEL